MRQAAQLQQGGHDVDALDEIFDDSARSADAAGHRMMSGMLVSSP